jgi:hypothetical protein
VQTSETTTKSPQRPARAAIKYPSAHPNEVFFTALGEWCRHNRTYPRIAVVSDDLWAPMAQSSGFSTRQGNQVAGITVYRTDVSDKTIVFGG